MTSYTSSDFNNVFINKEGEIQEVVGTLSKLVIGDFIDVSALIPSGRKIYSARLYDHAANIHGGSTSLTTNSEFHYALTAGTGVFRVVSGSGSSDAIVEFKLIPS